MALPASITIPDGRVFKLKEVDPGDMLDLIEAAGSVMNGQAASAWLGYAQMIATVSEIDDVPVPFPGSKAEVKNLARRIGNAGIVALQKAIMPEEGQGTELDAAKN